MRYYSTWSTSIRATCGFVAIIAFLIYFRGSSIDVFIGIVMMSIYIMFLVWERYHVYIDIKDNRYIRNAGVKDFWEEDPLIDLFAVKYIGRTYGGLGSGFGGKMVFFVLEKDGTLAQTNFDEGLYDDSILVELLKKVKSLNPNIIIDPQYEQYKNKTAHIQSRLKNLRPTKNQFELTLHVKQKLGKNDTPTS